MFVGKDPMCACVCVTMRGECLTVWTGGFGVMQQVHCSHTLWPSYLTAPTNPTPCSHSCSHHSSHTLQLTGPTAPHILQT